MRLLRIDAAHPVRDTTSAERGAGTVSQQTQNLGSGARRGAGSRFFGMGIKKEHPIVQVAIYDGVDSVNKIIELP